MGHSWVVWLVSIHQETKANHSTQATSKPSKFGGGSTLKAGINVREILDRKDEHLPFLQPRASIPIRTPPLNPPCPGYKCPFPSHSLHHQEIALL
jgi:hypothetical protein